MLENSVEKKCTLSLSSASNSLRKFSSMTLLDMGWCYHSNGCSTVQKFAVFRGRVVAVFVQVPLFHDHRKQDFSSAASLSRVCRTRVKVRHSLKRKVCTNRKR